MRSFFNVSESVIQATITYNFLGYFLGALLYGPLSDSFGRRKMMLFGNTQLRNHMWGCNDFLVTGVLNNYERLSSLSYFKVNTLITVGGYDFISPTTCKKYAELMSSAQLAIIQGASHNPHLEQPKLYAEVLHSWLDSTQSTHQ
ncbi:alpha/beta fold hydrolase [Legionella longbeachae]|uniref:alpha/beta fold hydrolase n=1 Tax=Legionella longbeachae TaxID=450 RepID=UPI0001BEC37E|nr:alpha/beta hydrolase [Legionella longbeachae]VEE03884.1 major facilitator superfamily (MFS) transporter [Legionella oakridgensis]HBD7397335.1 MFS transporter [Legionella pneumophila]ARB93259.1 MFS transporter [Legionella longbeachae]ARM33677.1 MFS transporter [Legionella longbeachae]EEZ93395.1 proline iminopeptidase-like protein [Legionella longbeachae D-4968]